MRQPHFFCHPSSDCGHYNESSTRHKYSFQSLTSPFILFFKLQASTFSKALWTSYCSSSTSTITMQFSTTISMLAVLTAFASAQTASQNATAAALAAQVPECARACDDAAITKVGCNLDDYSCHCAHGSQLSTIIPPCLKNSTCTPTDLQSMFLSSDHPVERRAGLNVSLLMAFDNCSVRCDTCKDLRCVKWDDVEQFYHERVDGYWLGDCYTFWSVVDDRRERGFGIVFEFGSFQQCSIHSVRCGRCWYSGSLPLKGVRRQKLKR